MGTECEYQAAISRMGRATFGPFRSAPLGIIAGESGLTPTRALLDCRQARFTQQLLARPQGCSRPEEIISRRGSALMERLKTATLLRSGGQSRKAGAGEVQELSRKHSQRRERGGHSDSEEVEEQEQDDLDRRV